MFKLSKKMIINFHKNSHKLIWEHLKIYDKITTIECVKILENFKKYINNYPPPPSLPYAPHVQNSLELSYKPEIWYTSTHICSFRKYTF